MGNMCADTRTAEQKEKDEFLWMINKMPTVSNYSKNKSRILNISKAWASPYFGGSVLKPLGAINKKRTRNNGLEQGIKDMHI